MIAGFVTAGTGTGEPSAFAQVIHQTGFNATVAGWSSWYGNYGMGPLGWGWCIDHGIPAPDADYGYVPATIDDETDGNAQAAMAWAATMYMPTDAVESAAIMLALHDLRQAMYPTGLLNVDAMGPDRLSGFGGYETAVLERARAIKADALAHAHLRAPFTLSISLVPTDPGVETAGWAILTDTFGSLVSGAPVTVQAAGATLTSAATTRTIDNGSIGFTFVSALGDNSFVATALVPDNRPRIFAPTAVRAQRIIQPWMLEVGADATFAATPPTTAPPLTTPPTAPTTTAPPETTTTTAPTTTTTAPATTTTTTTTPAPSTTTTTPEAQATTTTRRLPRPPRPPPPHLRRVAQPAQPPQPAQPCRPQRRPPSPAHP